MSDDATPTPTSTPTPAEESPDAAGVDDTGAEPAYDGSVVAAGRPVRVGVQLQPQHATQLSDVSLEGLARGYATRPRLPAPSVWCFRREAWLSQLLSSAQVWARASQVWRPQPWLIS